LWDAATGKLIGKRLGTKSSETAEDLRLGGGVATIQQYLREGLIDEIHLAIAPVLLGSGERLFVGVDMVALGYECAEHVGTPNATHVVIRKQ
jgi:dihydrofolate reductase